MSGKKVGTGAITKHPGKAGETKHIAIGRSPFFFFLSKIWQGNSKLYEKNRIF